MKQLTPVIEWYENLQARERLMVTGAGLLVIVTLFYLLLWEPLYDGLEMEQQKLKNQQNIIGWMQQAAVEARGLRASGVRTSNRNRNTPVSLAVEQTIGNSGLKSKLAKLESSGKDSARVRLNQVSFNQMIIWINNLESSYGISTSSLSIDRTDKAGIVNARINLSRSQ